MNLTIFVANLAAYGRQFDDFGREFDDFCREFCSPGLTGTVRPAVNRSDIVN